MNELHSKHSDEVGFTFAKPSDFPNSSQKSNTSVMEQPLDSAFQMVDLEQRADYPCCSKTGKTLFTYKLYRGEHGERVKVSYCKNWKESETVAQRFLGCHVLGFDIEWKPGGGSRIIDNVSLIQLASDKEIGLFHLAIHDGSTPQELLAPTLKSVLESPKILKVGCYITGDGNRLCQYLEVQPHAFMEINELWKTIDQDAKYMSLSKLADLAIGLPVAKDRTRLSNWCLNLFQNQKDYAATDAYAGLVLFREMKSRLASMQPQPDLPPFVDFRGVIKTVTLGSSQSSDTNGPSSQTSEMDPRFRRVSSRGQKLGLEGHEAVLFDHLAQCRLELQAKENKIVWQIANNEHLIQMARSVPRTVDELRQIKGFGEVRTKKYGPAFLKVLNEQNSAVREYSQMNSSQSSVETSLDALTSSPPSSQGTLFSYSPASSPASITESTEIDLKKKVVRSALEAIRRQLGKKMRIQPEEIVSDDTLEELSEVRPKNHSQLNRIDGGLEFHTKAMCHGLSVLETIREAHRRVSPTT